MHSFWKKFNRERVKPIFYTQLGLLGILLIMLIILDNNMGILKYAWLFNVGVGIGNLLTALESYILKKKDYMIWIILALGWFALGVSNFHNMYRY